MPVEVKGRIKFNPDVKPDQSQYIIESPQLSISEEGSGNLEQMIDELTERVRREIAGEFKCAPASVGIIGYSMGITFSIVGPINQTLDKFTDIALKVAQSPDGDKIVETTSKIIEISKATGIPAQVVFDMAKTKLDAQKKKGKTS